MWMTLQRLALVEVEVGAVEKKKALVLADDGEMDEAQTKKS